MSSEDVQPGVHAICAKGKHYKVSLARFNLSSYSIVSPSPCSLFSLLVGPPTPNEKNIASQLIGKGGANIKRIMKESEAKIVLKEFDSGNRDVVITGTPRNVEV